MNDIYRIRQLAGLTKKNLNEDIDANTYVKDSLSEFFTKLFDDTAENLNSITEQLYNLETETLNEENIAMLADMKLIVDTLAKIKTKY